MEWKRGKNRSKITTAANGAPPLDADVAKKLGIAINTNWGELATLLAHARRQYYNSFLQGTRYFRIKIPNAPEQIRASYENIITEKINKPLKKNKTFFHLHQYRWTDVVVHGVASVMWPNRHCWKPQFVAREDLRIPTDTTTDFENLSWFGNRKLYTIGELVSAVWDDEDPDNGWSKEDVAAILKNYKEVNYDSPQTYIMWDSEPEKLAELVKQNMGYYESDAVPKIPIWIFCFQDTDGKWYKRAIPDTPAIRGASKEPDKFLYKTEESCADNLPELLQCQFGDLSFKTPFMFHSVRSLGFELLEPTYWSNLTSCRFLQHVHDNFNRWIQVTDPATKERAQNIEWQGPTVRVPAGVSILNQQQRHQVDPEMVEAAMSRLKQLMQESSASYTQDTDTGTKKEQTAFETGVKVQQVNSMLSGLMLVAQTVEVFLYQEISRRFCLRDSEDKDVRKFQEQVINRAGIPRKWINVDQWEIEVDAPLGAGNPTLEQVEAQKAIDLSSLANPTAKQEMLHDAFTVFFGAKRANRWVPMTAQPRVTEAKAQAQSDFASLMWGIEVAIRDELNPQEQIDVLLNSLAQMVNKITKAQGGTPTPEILQGLANVSQHVKELIQIAAQNPQNKQFVRAVSDALGRLDNELKAFAQRLQERQKKAMQEQLKAQNGEGERAAKARGMLMESGTKSRISSQESQQKMQIKQAEFLADQQRANLKLAGELERNRLKGIEEE